MRWLHRRNLTRKWRKGGRPLVRHPFDRGWYTDREVELISYWLRATAHRRHAAPFNKTRRGMDRRAEKLHKLSKREELLSCRGE